MKKTFVAALTLAFAFALVSTPILIPAVTTAETSGVKFALEFPMEGPRSQYTEPLIQLARSWPPKLVDLLYPPAGENPVLLNRVDTPGNEFFIGHLTLQPMQHPAFSHDDE